MVLPGVPEVGGPVFSRGQLAAPTPPRGGLAARRAVALAVRWLRPDHSRPSGRTLILVAAARGRPAAARSTRKARDANATAGA